MPLDVLDVQALRRWVITARTSLAQHAEAINALNVFPVPDRDTGTNMSLTMNLAVDGLAGEAPVDLLSSVRVLARATVLSARGNSGVILSQLVRGLADVVVEVGGAPLGPVDLGRVLRQAATAATAGVRAPVEGTMLSVADAAASAAERATGAELVEMVDVVLQAAGVAVERTRDQLPVLRQAGVVDAGAVGYWLVLQALSHVVHQTPGPVLPTQEVPAWLQAPVSDCRPGVGPGVGPGAAGSGQGPGGPDGPSYELMFVLEDADDEAVRRLTGVLDGLGDSVVATGGPEVWSVHAHLDDLGAGVNAAVAAGRAGGFRITRFADQVGSAAAQFGRGRILILLASPGLREVVSADGIRVVDGLDGLDGLDGIDGLDGVYLVLTDDPALQERAVGRFPAGRVATSRHPAQLLAALAVAVEQADADVLRADCEAAVGDVRTVTVPAGIPDQLTRARAEIARLVADTDGADGAELLTLVAGAQADPDLLQQVARLARADHPSLEVSTYTGGRPGVVLDLGLE